MILDETQDNAYLTAIRNGTLKEGLGINCDLDNHLRFKQGSFNVILGHANVGKTDWIVWYQVCHAMLNSINWLIYSSENRIGSIKRKILEFKVGKSLTEMNDNEFNKANTWMNFKFKFVDTSRLYTAKELLDCMEKSKDQFDGAIIDPYNSLVKDLTGTNSHEYDYKTASEIRLFCQKNNKTVYVVAHAATEALRKTHSKDHIYSGHSIPPNAADIEGGGKWVNRADDFIVLHRYLQHEHEWFITQVHVRKVKETETGGKPTFIDEPVKCVKWKQSFTINQVNPMNGEKIEQKPLPLNTEFDKTVQIAKEKIEEETKYTWMDKDPDEMLF